MNPVESAAALLGRRGGSVGSPAQKAAARENGKLGGRPRKAKRCPCGAMTLRRAKARGHRCTASIV